MEAERSRHSLRRTLFGLVAVLAVSFLGLAAAGVWVAFQGERERAELRLLGQARTLAVAVDSEFAKTEAVLATLAASGNLRAADWPAFYDEARIVSRILGGAPLALTDREGRQAFHSDWSRGERRTGIRSVGLWKQVIESGQARFTNVYHSPNTGKLYLAVSVPVFDAEGRALYALAAGRELGALSDLLVRQRLPQGWVSSIVDRDGTRVARNVNTSADFVGSRANAALLEALKAAPHGVVHVRTNEGIDASAAYARAERTGYVATIAAPRESLLAPLRSTLMWIVGAGMVIAAAGLAFAVVLARRIADALQRVAATAAGDAGRSGFAEVDELADALRTAQAERLRLIECERAAHEELRELAAAANSAREQEKSRMARELHDELAQSLTALKMDAKWLARQLKDRPDVLPKIGDMSGLLDATVAATRRISTDLRPLVLDDLGLVPAVEWLIQRFVERTGIECRLAPRDVDELELDDERATAVFRIIQESLTNIARHANATGAQVLIERDGNTLTVTIEDNGCGFAAGAPRKRTSYGLMGLRERAHLLDGTAEVRSIPGKGTTIHVRLPLRSRGPQSQDAAAA